MSKKKSMSRKGGEEKGRDPPAAGGRQPWSNKGGTNRFPWFRSPAEAGVRRAIRRPPPRWPEDPSWQARAGAAPASTRGELRWWGLLGGSVEG